MGILFILNPKAGKVRPEVTAGLIKEVMDPAGRRYDIMLTTEAGGAAEMARRAKAGGFSAVCAVGGDGTIQEVAQGCVSAGVAMGFVPTGNGNDFAKTYNASRSIVPPKEPEERIRWYTRRLLAPHTNAIDTIASGAFVSVNVAGVGLDSEIARDGSLLKDKFGKLSYIASTIKNAITFKPFEGRVVYDGTAVEGRFAFVSACNGKFYGGGFNIAPRAEIDDGILELVIAKAMPRAKILALFPTVLAGKHEGIKQLSFTRCKRVDIFFEGDRYVNYDGNTLLLKSPITFEVKPKALEMY